MQLYRIELKISTLAYCMSFVVEWFLAKLWSLNKSFCVLSASQNLVCVTSRKLLVQIHLNFTGQTK
jgi:hypothetical protein